MSKICLKNIKSQLRDCLPLQGSSRFAYSRRYSNPVSIRGDQGIGIRSRCLRIAEPHPTNRAKELGKCNNEALICEMLRVYKPSNLKARWRSFCLITHRTIKKING